MCRLRFTVPLTTPIPKGAYVTGLADLIAYSLSFSYRSQTNAFFILLYVRMDDNGFRHPHSRKPDLLSLVTDLSQFRGDLAYVSAPSIAYPSPFCPTFLPGR
jgi:hypothetical protein